MWPRDVASPLHVLRAVVAAHGQQEGGVGVRRSDKLKQFKAIHLVRARLVRAEDPPRAHLMYEASSHALCGPLGHSIAESDAKTLVRCDDCESAASWKAARSA